MAVFLTRTLGQDQIPPPAPPTFADVPADYWADAQIEAFAELGITTGCGLYELGQGVDQRHAAQRGDGRASGNRLCGATR